MLDATINQLADHLKNRFPATRDYSRAELKDMPAGMPAPIAHYLTHRIDAKMTAHLERLETEPWIDDRNPALQEAVNRMRQALDKAARIPGDSWSGLLTEAVREVMRYLVDPIGSLTDFIFNDEQRLPISTVARRAGYFSAYSYLHSVFEAYATRKSLQTIDRERFEQVLSRIDRQMLADYDAEQWEKLFEPLYKIVPITTSSGPNPQVPADLLRRLAANKQFDALAHQLERQGENSLSRNALKTSIQAALEHPSASRAQAPVEPAGKAVEDSGPQPRWKQFQRSGETPPVVSSPSRRPQPRPTPASSEDNRPLWQRFQRGESENPTNDRPPVSPAPTSTQPTADAVSSSLDDLEQAVLGLLPDDQRKRFINRLFNGSQRRYSEILTELNQVDSWEQASTIIAKKVFLPHQINIYSEPAVTFTDLVESRYRQSA